MAEEAEMAKWMESGVKRGRQPPRIEQGRGQAPGTGGYWLVCVEHKALAGCGLLAAEHSPPPPRIVPPARVFIGKLAFTAILSDFRLLGV